VVAAVLLLGAAACDHRRDTSRHSAYVLADGSLPPSLPAALRRFDGKSVVATRELEDATRIARACPPPHELRRRTSNNRAWISVDGLSIEYPVKASRLLWACDAVFGRGRWRRCAGALGRFRNPERLAQSGGAVDLVCWPYRDGIAFMWIAAPQGVSWALVDHGSFWMAYKAPRTRRLRVSGTSGIDNRGSFRLDVAFLDAHLHELDRREVEGAVAG
jgi:hypothetical protein